MGGSNYCYLFNAVATVDVFTASNNDINFVETQAVHFAVLLNLPYRNFSLWQISSFVCPLKYHITLLLSHQF